VIAMPGKIGVAVVIESHQGEQDLEQEHREREETDRVEDLLLDQKRVPPFSHL